MNEHDGKLHRTGCFSLGLMAALLFLFLDAVKGREEKRIAEDKRLKAEEKDQLKAERMAQKKQLAEAKKQQRQQREEEQLQKKKQQSSQRTSL